MAIRNELSAVAVRLFTEHGFAEPTARDIAHAVGVSERTFFRYFASKEDVVFGAQQEIGAHLASRLAARPANEAPFRELRRGFDLVTEIVAKEPEWSLAMLPVTRRIRLRRIRRRGGDPGPCGSDMAAAW
jgi:AcrR family transcriptional regulator